MKNFQIWESDFNHNSERGGMLIPTKEISQMIDLSGITYYGIEGISVNMIDELNKFQKEYDRINNEDDLEFFLKSNNIEFTEIMLLSNIEQPRELVIYDATYDYVFSNLDYCETGKYYQWHDGSNIKDEWAGENDAVTEVIVEDNKYLDLDEQDDNGNWCTGGNKFYHETVYKVIELDSEKVDNMFLLCEWSQWQGDHETGRILSKDELDEHLKKIGYNID